MISIARALPETRTAAVAATVLFAITLAGPAHAQIQNSGQRKCITSLNKAASKLAKAQGRQVSGCMKDATRLIIPASALESCINDPGSKVQKALTKVVETEAKSCADTPAFGFSGATTTSQVVVSQGLALAADIFGEDFEAALVTEADDDDAASCQARIAKRYPRIVDEILKEFLACKKQGLATGAITSALSLEQSCFDAVEADVKGKIFRAGEKLGKDYIKRCLELPDPSAPFPGDCQSAPDILTCIKEHARCRACLQLRNADNLAKDCETFDNGELDGSCVDPNADECAGENGGHNCDENATCTDEPEGFSCACDPGYSGDGVICEDENECAGEGGGDNCLPLATCNNTEGGFECVCPAGTVGDGVTICDDLDECAGQGGGHDCDPNATCTNTYGGYLCTCNPGYVGSGQSCVDADECIGEGGGNNCDVNALCVNTDPGFTCTCNAGFKGDGVTCADCDECAGEGTGHNCDINATCINTPGSFTCVCNPGFSGDGVTCQDIDECFEGTHDCDSNATCNNEIGGYTCTCNAGYHGDGTVCIDDNECVGEGSGNNCSVNAECTNLEPGFSCACQKGHYGQPVGSVCDPILVDLTSPTHGIFTQAGSIAVTGQVTTDPIGDVSLTINGNSVAIQPNGSFSTTIPLDPQIIFNEVRAELTHTPTGFTVRDRRVVIVGPTAPFDGVGELTQSVGLRINDTGFDALEPILTGLVDFDINDLLPVGTPVLENSICVEEVLGVCVASVEEVTLTQASLGGFGIDIDSMTNFVAGDVLLSNLFVDVQVDLKIAGIPTTCDSFQLTAATTNILGDYALEPDPGDATVIDVNQLGAANVVFGGFNDNVDCGGIGFLTFLINLVGADVQGLMEGAFEDFMADPPGPADAPIAQAIEDALADVELTGPIGEGFGVNLDTPLFAIPEDTLGLTLASGAIMSTLNPAPGTPTFDETLVIPATYPFNELATGVTPVGGVAYGMGLGIAESGFNQIMAALVESGSMNQEISEIDISGGGNPVPITAGLFALLLPEFGDLDPLLPLRLRISPTLAPVLTGSTGAGGELAELAMSHLLIDIISGPVGMESLHARLAVDLISAFDLTIEAGTGNLVPAIGEPSPNDILITLLDNPLCLSEATLQTVIPALFAPQLPQLAGAFGSFPLPQFLGLQPTAVEVSRVGDFLGVFLDVVPSP